MSEQPKNIFMDLLCGVGITGTYKNTNLCTYANNACSVEERSSKNISPPLMLNSEYLAPPFKKKTKKTKVDPNLLKEFS